MEKLRQDFGEMDESYKSFRHSHWAFSKVPLSHSVSIINDAESEDTALHVFQSILAYSGLLEQGNAMFLNLYLFMHFFFFFFHVKEVSLCVCVFFLKKFWFCCLK